MDMRRFLLLMAAAVLAFSPAAAARKQGKSPDDGYRLLSDVSYVDADETDAYRLERCKLDIYYPEKAEGFATLVWFHGGGLTGGQKHLMDEFRRQGFAVVAVNYRLYPGVKCPGYICDAAQATAWVFRHIAEFGGDPDKICLSGHSAGGYLSLMLTLDKSYLEAYGVDADRIAKSYPISGQCMTHYTIRVERGLSPDIPIIDKFAPVNNARKEGAPLVLITGGRELELLARYEENLHLYAILKHFGHPVVLYEMEGFDHGTVLGPAACWIREDIKKLSAI